MHTDTYPNRNLLRSPSATHHQSCTAKQTNDNMTFQELISDNRNLDYMKHKIYYLNNSVGPSDILKTYCISNFITKFSFHLFADSFGNTHSSYTSWLSASNYTADCVLIFMKILEESQISQVFSQYRTK